MFRLGIIITVTKKSLSSPIRQKCTKLAKRQFKTNLFSLNYNQNISSNITYKYLSQATKPEQDFLIRLKNDPDTFGESQQPEKLDELDLKEQKYLEERPSPTQKLSTKQYADLIKSFIQKRKIKEAIDVLEVKMLKEDKVKPENYIYNLLLGACGRVGYTKKAFSLYNNMKKRGLKVTPGTYTALFNACANSPWPQDGLTRAKHLHNIMIEKMYEPNATNYNSMIKAFGRCGDLETAFSLVDEMTAKRIPIKDETMNFLLQACIQDKNAGFRHALLVWKKMSQKHIPPSFYTYNLMLRCIRDCGIGDVEVMKDTIQLLLPQTPPIQNDNKLLLEASTEGKLIAETQTFLPQIGESQDDVCRPNLMARIPHLGNIVEISEVTKAEDRLLLVGGYKGFLNNMIENECTPNIKTFTQLLDCLPGSITIEQELLKVMKKFDVTPDIDFFNMLIKKRSIRFDYSGGRAVLDDMKNFNYRPNLITFGVLALGCKTKEEALSLIEEMTQHSYRLNTEILGAMLHQACYHKNFSYVLEIMEITLKENVKPNKKFMETLSEFKKRCKDISNDKDNELFQKTWFQKGFRVFQMRYKTWVDEVQVDDTEDIHPWAQYRQNTETDTRHYKEKGDRFKPKRLSKFKVKTSTKKRY